MSAGHYSFDVVEDFRAAVRAALGTAPEVIERGRIHRFATNGRRGDTAGWCQLFADLRGGCSKLGLQVSWSAIDRRNIGRGQRIDLARRCAAAELLAAHVPRDRGEWLAIVIEDRWQRMVRELCRPVAVEPSADQVITIGRHVEVGADGFTNVGAAAHARVERGLS